MAFVSKHTNGQYQRVVSFGLVGASRGPSIALRREALGTCTECPPPKTALLRFRPAEAVVFTAAAARPLNHSLASPAVTTAAGAAYPVTRGKVRKSITSRYVIGTRRDIARLAVAAAVLAVLAAVAAIASGMGPVIKEA